MINLNKKLYWLFTLAWMAAIFGLSSVGSFSAITGAEKRNDFVSDAVHVFLYLILTWLLIKSFLASGFSRTKSIIFGIILSALYGITDEWHQSYVPGREAHVSDWLFDVFGSVLAVVILKIKKLAK